MLQTKSLGKVYKTGKTEVCALKDVTLSFPERGLVFVAGRSGKTTLLNLIGGLDRPPAGK